MANKPVVLCIDDQAVNLQIRTQLLEQFGCETMSATDHASALRALEQKQVDVIVIDYHLANGETGEDIARDVRVLRPGLPLIMLTGDSRLPESAIACVDAVLIKGASNPRALFDLIEKLVPAAELRQRHAMVISDPREQADER